MRKALIVAASVLALTLGGQAFAQDTNSPSINGNSDGSGNNKLVNKVLTLSLTDSSTKTVDKSRSNSQDNGSYNNNNAVTANQDLSAVNSNHSINDVVEMADGSNYNSGSNSVSGGAFAAFAGVLNQGWTTGVNANAQAATNIAAQGNISFGSATH